MSAQGLMILNLSQESFSDGGKLSSANAFVERVTELKKLGLTCYDLGAQSTAPNRKHLINAEEEWLRFFSILTKALERDPDLWKGIQFLSIDTFRPSTFVQVFKLLRSSGYRGDIAFNDVSGCYRDGLASLVDTLGESFSYFLCHNRVPSREQTPFHIQFQSAVKDQNILEEVLTFFQEGRSFLRDIIAPEQLFFDPCFGFAKSYEENWSLLQNPQWFKNLSIILGISRKSFLRQKVRAIIPDVSDDECMQLSELYHYQIIKKWCTEIQGHCWVRSHSPHLVLIALDQIPAKREIF